MDRPPVLCVGVLVCVKTAGLPQIHDRRHELIQGNVLTIGSAEGCRGGRVNVDYLSPYHCVIKVSVHSSDAIIKSTTEKGYTGLRGPRGESTLRLEKNSPVLLKSGYEIFLGKSSSQYITLKFIAYDSLSVFAKYEFGKALGQGTFGQVFAVRDRRTKQIRAVKCSKYGSQMDPYFSATVKTEYEILKAISHPNVVAMVEGFREPGSFMIVLEFAKYGDLLGFSQIYALDEKLVANIAGQMLEGIYHLHLQNIAHIDIKPMNVLVFCKSPCIVKISDFGLALPCEPGNGIVGTPAYQAPEASVGLRWHAAKLDAFSLGASFFQLLAPDRGVPCRFARGVQGELLQPLQRLPICWERLPELLTSAGRTLLQGLLDYEPKGRTGVAEALGHPWIKWGKS